MATLIFYANRDIGSSGQATPTPSGSFYSVVGSNDGDSTYARMRINSASSMTNTFEVGFGGSFGTSVKISSIKVGIVARSASSSSKDTKDISWKITANGISQSSSTSGLSTSYTEYGASYSAATFGLTGIYSDINSLGVQVETTISGKQESSKTDAFDNFVTYVYVEVTYTEVSAYDCTAVAVNNIASATVNPNVVAPGETATFTAITNEYCHFDGWYSNSACTDLVSTANPYSTTITAPTTLYAKASKETYTFELGSQPRTGRGTATVNKSTAQYPDTVTFKCIPSSNEYVFYGWFEDPQGINLISTEATYTAPATRSLKLYPKVDRLVTRTLSIPYGQGKTYMTANHTTLDFNVLYQAVSVLYLASTVDGTSTFNSAAMSVLYTNSKAHPVKMDISLHCGRQGSITDGLTDADYLQFRVNGVAVDTFRPNASQGVAYTLNWQTTTEIINSSRASTIDLYHHAKKAYGTGRAVGFNDVTVTTYFIGYKNQVFIADNCPAIKSVSVSQEFSAEYDTVVFSAQLAKGATWDGWYSDPACTNRVSSNIQYSVESTTDITLYGKANGAPVYTCNAIAGEHVTGVTVENSKVVGGNTIQFTAIGVDAHYAFDGWYLDNGYTNKVSSSLTYVHTINSDTTLYAKAEPIIYHITLGQSEGGTATATVTSGTYNTSTVLRWTADDNEWYTFDYWSSGDFDVDPADADYYSTQSISPGALVLFECPEPNKYILANKTNITSYSFNADHKYVVLWNDQLFINVPVHACRYKRSYAGGSSLDYTLVLGGQDYGYPFGIYTVKNSSSTDPILGWSGSDTAMFYVFDSTQHNFSILSSDNPYTHYITDDITIVPVVVERPWYKCMALHDDGCTTSVSVQDGHVLVGNSITFTCVLKDGYEFVGWYSDDTYETLITTDLSYTVTPEAAMTIYAQTNQVEIITTGIYIKRNSAYAESLAVYKKIDGAWVIMSNADAKEYLQNNKIKWE